MKKRYLIFILLLVGCSKQIKCSNEEVNVIIKEKKNSIKSIEVEKVFKNEEESTNYCTLLKLTDISVECDKNRVVYNNYKDYLNRDFIKTDGLIEYLENNNYNCK
ncbi:unknown [Firmicutes bacterium CAG:884]|nr:unknown [Firmicutes bacterium CAG:884]